MIATVKSSPNIHSILQVDWLHFVETVLFWTAIHVQCISFRDAVDCVERRASLPVSALFDILVLITGVLRQVIHRLLSL